MLIIRLLYCNRLRLRKMAQNTTIVHKKHSTYPQVENITILPEHLFSLKNTTTFLLKRQRHRSIRIGHIFHGAFRRLFFYNQKSFARRRLRRCRLRNKIHAIKTRPNNPLRFLQRKNSYPSLFGKRFNLCRSQNDVQNTKAFSQQTISTKIKSSTAWIRALILTQGLTTATLQCTVKPLFFFFFIKTQPFNKKPKQNYIKQSQQTIRKNNPKSLNQKHAQNIP